MVFRRIVMIFLLLVLFYMPQKSYSQKKYFAKPEKPYSFFLQSGTMTGIGLGGRLDLFKKMGFEVMTGFLFPRNSVLPYPYPGNIVNITARIRYDFLGRIYGTLGMYTGLFNLTEEVEIYELEQYDILEWFSGLNITAGYNGIFKKVSIEVGAVLGIKDDIQKIVKAPFHTYRIAFKREPRDLGFNPHATLRIRL